MPVSLFPLIRFGTSTWTYEGWQSQIPRYGARAGQPNPRFLDAKLFNELVLAPYREAKFEPHTGAFLFEFQRYGMSEDEFCSRLDKFFLLLPRDFRYAVEVRNPGLLGRSYLQVLSRHGVAHVYNHWSGMPPLAEQHTRMQGFTAVFTVLRLLTPLGCPMQRRRSGLSRIPRSWRNSRR